MEDLGDMIGCKGIYRCPKRWQHLTETADPNVRFCAQCSENVFLVNTQEELIEKAKQGRCVASWNVSYGLGTDDTKMFIGEVGPDYMVKKPRKKKGK